MSTLGDVSHEELRITMAQLQGSREKIARLILEECERAGFTDRHARFMAACSLALGAGQLIALSEHGGLGMYQIFAALCACMAGSDARKVVMESAGLPELSPENMSPGGIILPDGAGA